MACGDLACCLFLQVVLQKGAGEMVQQLRALADVPEDPGLVLITHRQLTTDCDSSFREYDAFFWSCMHVVQAKHIH